jgi:Flp pilus assembly protein TadD
VLNNLAYEIATTKGKPQDALLYAERAATIAKVNPLIVDTLAWIQYLLGKNTEAVETIRRARALAGDEAEILFHSAAILAAAKDNTRASSELAAALKANPELAKREDVKKLQQQLAPPK